MNNVPLYVVNLESQPERRRFMESQLAALPDGFRIEWIRAVDGRALSETEIRADYDPAIAVRTTGRPLNRGEIGCALSHRAIYRRMIEVQEPFAVVLEDDVALGEEFPEVCLALAQQVDPERPRIFLLGNFFVPSVWKRPLRGTPFRLARAWRGRSTLAYALSSAAARALNSAQTPIRRAADWWPDLERNGIIETWGIHPPCAMAGVFNRSTGIGAGRAQMPVSFSLKLYRRWKTVWFQLTSWRL